MTFSFDSFDTEVKKGRLILPKELFPDECAPFLVFPSPYMTLRISDSAHFESVIDSTERLPEKHRRGLLRLMYGKSITAESAAEVAKAAVIIMAEIYSDKADFVDSEKPIPVRVENCGEYVQINVIG